LTLSLNYGAYGAARQDFSVLTLRYFLTVNDDLGRCINPYTGLAPSEPQERNTNLAVYDDSLINPACQN
jgi:hypothetical protein